MRSSLSTGKYIRNAFAYVMQKRFVGKSEATPKIGAAQTNPAFSPTSDNAELAEADANINRIIFCMHLCGITGHRNVSWQMPSLGSEQRISSRHFDPSRFSWRAAIAGVHNLCNHQSGRSSNPEAMDANLSNLKSQRDPVRRQRLHGQTS